MNIKIKKFNENAVIPVKATKYAAAYDVYTPEEVDVWYGRILIDLGFGIEIPEGYEAKLEPRSGNSAKGMKGTTIDVVSCKEYQGRFDADVIPGKIDSDYRGPLKVIINNRSGHRFTIKAHERIAQLTIYKVETADFEEVDKLSETERGEGGFGHTGSN